MRGSERYLISCMIERNGESNFERVDYHSLHIVEPSPFPMGIFNDKISKSKLWTALVVLTGF